MVQEQSSSHHHHHQQLPKYGTASPATGVARASKKNKPKKIPQRGLGVAQLEKLRLEEQKKMEGGGAVSSSMAHSRALGGGGLGHLLPLHPAPPPVPLSALPRPPAADGSLWDPATADTMKHQYKRMPPLPMVSTGLSLTAASSSHQTEPPSNQMYSSSGTRSGAAPAEEDREPASLDRSWPFMFEGMTAPAFRTSTTGKAGTPPVPPFAARMTTREATGFAPDLMMSRHEFRATNYFSGGNANYSDLAYCKNSKASNGCAGEPACLSLMSAQQHANLTKQPTHVIQPSHLPEYIMQSHQGSIAAPSRPFYSFLPAGPVRCERALGECRSDVSEGVDLELKL